MRSKDESWQAVCRRDMQLFSVATEQKVTLESPFDKPKLLPVSSVDIRRYTTLFADEVIRHFTGQKGVFSSRLAVVKRSSEGKRSTWCRQTVLKRFD